MVDSFPGMLQADQQIQRSHNTSIALPDMGTAFMPSCHLNLAMRSPAIIFLPII